MITTELYNGQGLGNQLFSYVMVRVLALDKGYDFGIMHPEKFKGASFIKLDFGRPVIGGESPYEGAAPTTLPQGITNYYCEKSLYHKNGSDIRQYDDSLKNISDNTKIDGYFQGEDYFKHRKNEIRSWLKVDLIDLPENLCIINFRGGEYLGHKELFLKQLYWDNAVAHMRKINPKMEFRVITDDVKTAKEFFPDFEISHNLEKDYRSIQSAKYLILSNSSFALLPAWLNQNVKLVIAPKYWARHNISDGYWACGYNIVKSWMYQDRDGGLHDYDSCIDELNEYIDKNKENFVQNRPTSLNHFPYLLKNKVARFFPNKIKIFFKKIIHI